MMSRLAIFVALFSVVYGRTPYAIKTTPVLEGRIVGGRDATIEQFPYQLSFELDDEHWCGAVLIKPNVAVTAAHCTEALHSDLKRIKIRTGSTIHGTGGQVSGVLKICDHPKFDVNDYDASVLLLEESFTINEKTQLITMQPVDVEISPGVCAVVTGWGATSFGGDASDVLQAVEVPRISDPVCASYYPNEDITSRMACYGYDKGEKDACQGDSGGPLVVNSKLAGIVSWGYGCAFPKLPNVYTKVSNPEIQEHINNCIVKFRNVSNV